MRSSPYFKNFFKMIAVFAIAITVLNCGSASNSTNQSSNNTSSTSTTDSSQSSNSSSFTSNVTMNFFLSLLIDAEDSDLDLNIELPESYSWPLKAISGGSLQARAQDFPTVVYRVCAPDTTTTGCDTINDSLGGLDVDIVIDSCGRLVADSQCGSTDTTLFSGTLTESGGLLIKSISIRMRAFLVTDEGNGYKADVTDEGLLVMNRLLITLTTGTATRGSLSGTGEALSQSGDATLVSVGTIGSSTPELGGSDFLSTLEVNFSENLFDYL
ncbi:MAG: hypothetical protein H7A33_04360 [Deltaproteobacteria bacterium]|nr:hypothetical protein [Deltaproteobacteria bacterium]